MHRLFLRSLILACVATGAVAGAAAADPAPIVYAGQGADGGSLQNTSLVGGGERSYGYGGATRSAGGAVIDIRRPAASTPARTIQPAVVAENETSAPGPQAPSQSEQSARPDWLEQERVGPPYEANGRWYVPTPEPGYEQTGTASWYGPQFHGQRAANGDVYDQEAMTAAHPTLPLNSLVQVTNLENGREVIVRVTDRGPFVGERLIDVSHGAAVALGFERAGHTRVHVRYLGPAPRRVTADGAPAPAPNAPPAPVEQGPASLAPPPPPAADSQLAGAPMTPEQPAIAPAPAMQPASGYFVQVGAFSDLSNAQRVRDAVSVAGAVSVDVRQTANGELFRVRIGPLATSQDVASAQQTLASLGYGQSIVAAR